MTISFQSLDAWWETRKGEVLFGNRAVDQSLELPSLLFYRLISYTHTILPEFLNTSRLPSALSSAIKNTAHFQFIWKAESGVSGVLLWSCVATSEMIPSVSFSSLILSSFWPSNCAFWPPFDCLYRPDASVYSLPQLRLCLRFHILRASFLHPSDPEADSFRSVRRIEKHLSFYLHGTPTTLRTSAWSFSMYLTWVLCSSLTWFSSRSCGHLHSYTYQSSILCNPATRTEPDAFPHSFVYIHPPQPLISISYSSFFGKPTPSWPRLLRIDKAKLQANNGLSLAASWNHTHR